MVMSNHARDKAVIPFTPSPNAHSQLDADDSGRAIIGMLHKASDMAKDDCARAMDLAHKLQLQLRAAEQRVRETEAEAAHFRDRATRAEAWLVRIHNEAEQIFFQREERDSGQVRAV
jgi:F0F1-type ATP synthase membrane subunit b/b'